VLDVPRDVKATLASPALGIVPGAKYAPIGIAKAANVAPSSPAGATPFGTTKKDNTIVGSLVGVDGSPITVSVPTDAIEATLTLPDGTKQKLKVLPGPGSAGAPQGLANSPALFHVLIDSKTPGDHLLDVSVAGLPALESSIPFTLLDVPAKLVASLCGPGAQVANTKVPAILYADIDDSDGKPVKISPKALNVVIEDPNGKKVPANVQTLDENPFDKILPDIN